jgi:steroid delta-isomerase-like uncharacterized protein
MSLEENKAILRRLAEAINEKDLNALDDIMAPDFVDPEQNLSGLDSFKKYESMFLNAFPDMHMTIKDIIAKDDKVWASIEVIMTHKGEFRGIPPTGNKIKLTSFQIWRIAEGKIAERQSQVWDFMDFYKHLGIIQYTEKGKKLFQKQ